MNYLQLSIKELNSINEKLAEQISETYSPDVIIFIAKGSFLIGESLSNYFKIPLVQIFAERKSNRLKEIISPLLRIIPTFIKNKLRKLEVTSGTHDKNSDREVYIIEGEQVLNDSSRILIVDDSIDTGNTASQVKEYIANRFSDKEIKFACINYFESNMKNFQADYSVFKDSIIIGPWSKDSKHYKEHSKRYEKWSTN